MYHDFDQYIMINMSCINKSNISRHDVSNIIYIYIYIKKKNYIKKNRKPHINQLSIKSTLKEVPEFPTQWLIKYEKKLNYTMIAQMRLYTYGST